MGTLKAQSHRNRRGWSHQKRFFYLLSLHSLLQICKSCKIGPRAMENPFQIWVDRLKTGKTQFIDETPSPEFLDLVEDELKADQSVIVKGKAYLTETDLILNLDASTSVEMPCSICNKMTGVELKIENFYHAQPLDKIPSGIYDFRTPLREALILELPKYVECSKGKCPERTVITPYLKGKERTEDVHFPFSGLNELGDSNGSTS